jgi:hypothetical protein
VKQCSSCRRLRSLEDFHRNSHHKDGRSYDCKQCRRLGYWNLSDREKRRKRALRIQREGKDPHNAARDKKKRCFVCHKTFAFSVFQPDRVEPDGGNECAECSGIRPWLSTALLRARKQLLTHLAIYNSLPLAVNIT